MCTNWIWNFDDIVVVCREFRKISYFLQFSILDLCKDCWRVSKLEPSVQYFNYDNLLYLIIYLISSESAAVSTYLPFASVNSR